ncbi:hypothetical protein NSS69_08295 [Macrococcus sp. FSL W8-0367]
MEKQEVFKQVVIELKNLPTTERIEALVENMKNIYNIPSALTLSMINRKHDESFFKTTDIRLITLFIMEAFKVLGRSELIEKYVPIGEQQESKQYDFSAVRESKKQRLPITYQPVIQVNQMYSTKMRASELAELLDAGVINYNFDIQREAKLEIRTNEIIKRPTINRQNVNEMTQHLLNDTLKESTIYLNAAPKTSKSGDELVYNCAEYSLTITEGTRLDVLDGFHRILATQLASRTNLELDFEFNVMFANFTTQEALNWQVQHSKATAWSKNRVVEMQQGSRASKVAKGVKEYDSELEYLIFTGESKRLFSKNLISFNQLTKTIGGLYVLKTRRDEVQAIEEVSRALLSIQELKLALTKEINQAVVTALLHQFVHNFNRDEVKFEKFILEIINYSTTHKLNFSGTKLSDIQDKLDELKIKMKEEQ